MLVSQKLVNPLLAEDKDMGSKAYQNSAIES
jgi:hypothetical protein